MSASQEITGNSSLVHWLNKSTITNLVALGFIAIGYVSPVFSEPLLGIGFFALSGAVTNWLAIHMLFEKVPGLYGSGVIPSRFEEFKSGIRHLMMHQFFNEDNIQRFIAEQTDANNMGFSIEKVTAKIDFELLYERLVQGILESPFGAMLGMFGGREALDPMKPQIIEKLREVVAGLADSQEIKEDIDTMISEHFKPKNLIDKVEGIVQARLDELTPHMVKDIIQAMIRTHLGWLVVWGGVFGGLIGLVTTLANLYRIG